MIGLGSLVFAALVVGFVMEAIVNNMRRWFFGLDQ